MNKLPAFLADRIERHLEPGVAFSINPADPLWWVRVHFTSGLRPTVETIRAGGEEQARDFVLARYSFADPKRVEVLGVVGKVDAPVPLERRPPQPPATPPARAASPAPALRQQHTPKPASMPHTADPVPKPASEPAEAVAPEPPPAQAPAPEPASPAPRVVQVALERLPRDPRGRAVFQSDTDERILQARQAGWTWLRICTALDCSHAQAERRLRAYLAGGGRTTAQPPVAAVHAPQQPAAMQVPTGAPGIQALMADGYGGFRPVTVTLVVQSPDAA